MGRNSLIKNKAERALATVVETTKVMLPDIDVEFASLSPQQVMHTCMAWHMQNGHYDDAHRCARDLAPYVHARLANVNVNTSDEKPIEHMTAEELSALVRQLDIIDAEIIESDTEADPY
ncbi:hypothetical protein D3C80_1185560 [compost metagenome]